jgi:ribose transport system ATP-binding protein
MTIAVEHLSKSFPGTLALDDVDLRIENGEIHALAGANGSGKSTLVKVLTGVYQPDSGWITVDGIRLAGVHSPTEATRLGVRVVHQEAPLVDTLSVAECVALFRGYPSGVLGHVRWNELKRSVAELFKRLDIPVDPDALAGTLSPAERALVALAIALAGIEEKGHVLVLDEATASLPERDAAQFLGRVRTLAKTGIAVLMVTHRVSEIPSVADTLTVLANGIVVHQGVASEVDEDFIIARMVGQSTSSLDEQTDAPPRTSLEKLWQASGRGPLEAPGGTSILEVEHLSAEALADVSFTVGPGEIVGITGLSSSGVAQLPYLLAGSLDRTAGTIRVGGWAYPPEMSPALAIRSGVALVPSDRLRQGGVRTLSVRDNLILPDTRRYWRQGRRERAVVTAATDEFDVQPREPTILFEQLSGGNQQKVVLSKWLLTQPRLLILDDPTSGVDPRSRRLVFDAVRAAAASGIGVVLLSSEHEQLIAMCARVLVIRAGVVATELRGTDLTPEALARWSYV